MKKERIILLMVLCIGMGCKSKPTTKLPPHQETNSFRTSLANVVFYDGRNFTSSEVLDNSYSYKFGDTSYQKFVYAHYDEPFMTYLLESGDYEINELNLTFKPKIILRCRIEKIAENIDCDNSSYMYSNGFYVNRDTLNESQIKAFGFLPRVCRIAIEDKKMIFKDPGMPPYFRFQEILQ